MAPIGLSVVLFVLGILMALVGLAWIAVPLFVLAVVAFVWGLFVLLGNGPSKPVLHRTRKAELLGPGGPDDPDA